MTDAIPRRQALTLLAAAATLRPAHAAPLAKVKMLLPDRVVNEAFSPFTVAKYLGYFAAEGLDVALVPVGGSNEVAIAISGGAGDIGAASPGQALVGMQSQPQLDVKYFYDLLYRSIWTLTVVPESPIQSPADLKGKRLGVAAMGSAGITFGKALATEAGLDPERDVHFIAIGSGAQASTALSRKVVDAMVFSSQATTKFEANGFKLRYIDLGEGFASLPDVGLLARQSTLRDDPAMLAGFARAVAKGFVFSKANPAAAVRISWKLFPEAEPHNMPAEEALQGGVMVNKARMDMMDAPVTNGVFGTFVDRDWQRLVDYMQAQGILKQPLPLDRIYTNALIAQANAFDKPALIQQAEAFNLASLN